MVENKDHSLTDEQAAVVNDRSERLLVNALAGTGKTETVSQRVVSLVSGGVPPEEIALMCFTRSARDQLRGRLMRCGIDGVRVNTVHSLAWQTVAGRFESDGRPMPKIDRGERVMKEALTMLGHSPSDENLNAAQRASTALWNGSYSAMPFTTMAMKDLVRVVEVYAELKKQRYMLDFDDLVSLAASITSRKYEEVIVDEAQDLNALQVQFVSKLVGHRMIWVGDRNQSIFGFAGVDGDLFSKECADWEELALSQSFRSSQSILDVANRVAAVDLSSKIHGGSIQKSVSSQEETKSVCDFVKKGSCVIGRIKADLEPYAVALEKLGWSVSRSWKPLDHADVYVSTVHAAKGSEWNRVAVVSLNGSGFVGCDEAEEERRILYTAITRAKSDLYLQSVDGLWPYGV